MQFWVRAFAGVGLLAFGASVSIAATPKEIEDSIKRGTDALRQTYSQKIVVQSPIGAAGGNGIGPVALAGLAMLEGQVPVSDPAVKNVTETIRDAAFSQTKTYQLSLCLLYLDRYGDPADDPLIQILAVRLLRGQTALGGWGYDCIAMGTAGDEKALRAIKPEKGPPHLHPQVAAYAQTLMAPGQSQGSRTDDNSNTQFAVIAVWLSRKHGVPVDPALDEVAKRFMGSQGLDGGWPYNGTAGGHPAMNVAGSPAMYCAGLIGLATAVGRREEKRQKLDNPAPKPNPNAGKPMGNDPFFNPPTAPPPPPKKPVERPRDQLDIRVDAAFAGLGAAVAGSAQVGGGAFAYQPGGMHNVGDLYFYWSLERTCVIYGKEKVGGIDWYLAGAHSLVANQHADGTWGAKGYGAEVNTSFAVLFLCRSNLARDLSGKVQKETNTEMRTPSAGPNGGAKPNGETAPGIANTEPSGPVLPEASGSEAATMAALLVRSGEKEWGSQLKKLRESRGGAYTEALVTAANRLEGDRLKEARQALAERLARMTAQTLRSMAKSDEPELRRGAVLAMAMKEDKTHIPDLIAAITDDEEIVVRAAKAGLKSLTGQDLGPVKNATIGEKKIASEGWHEWYDKQKK